MTSTASKEQVECGLVTSNSQIKQYCTILVVRNSFVSHANNLTLKLLLLVEHVKMQQSGMVNYYQNLLLNSHSEQY